MDEKIKHLEMIQGVITRMASNSFALKALSVTLSAGVLAFAGSTNRPSSILTFAALLPLFVFWGLDAQYLRLERLFRKLFDDVRKSATSMEFSMNVSKYGAQVDTLPKIMFTWSQAGFYVPIALVLVVLACVLASRS